uniref:PDE4DIP n=1 Tax=Macrostomum lignano TaxID=282301 RepID=A0A1I8FW72_9PLAT
AIRADQLKVSPGPVQSELTSSESHLCSVQSELTSSESHLCSVQSELTSSESHLAQCSGPQCSRSRAHFRRAAHQALNLAPPAGAELPRSARLRKPAEMSRRLTSPGLVGYGAQQAVLGGIVVRGAEGDAQPAGDLPVGGAGHAHANQLLTLLSAELWRHLAPADFVEGWRLV